MKRGVIDEILLLSCFKDRYVEIRSRLENYDTFSIILNEEDFKRFLSEKMFRLEVVDGPSKHVVFYLLFNDWDSRWYILHLYLVKGEEGVKMAYERYRLFVGKKYWSELVENLLLRWV